jgi:hypothetical protein
VVRPGSTLNETYIIHDVGYTFDEAKAWCDKLRGHLPVVHNKEDLDFLMNYAVIKDYPGFTATWMGRTPVSKSGSCSPTWLTGEEVTFSKFDSVNSCSVCKKKDCCAMIVYNSGSYFSRIDYVNCTTPARKVCIIGGDIMGSLSDLLYPDHNYLHDVLKGFLFGFCLMFLLWLHGKRRRVRKEKSSPHMPDFSHAFNRIPMTLPPLPGENETNSSTHLHPQQQPPHSSQTHIRPLASFPNHTPLQNHGSLSIQRKEGSIQNGLHATSLIDTRSALGTGIETLGRSPKFETLDV